MKVIFARVMQRIPLHAVERLSLPVCLSVTLRSSAKTTKYIVEFLPLQQISWFSQK